MTTGKTTLAELVARRDRALLETKSHLDTLKGRMDDVESHLETFVVNHPVLALTGAVVAGAGIGALIPTNTVRGLATRSAAMIVAPLAGDIADRLTRLLSGDTPLK